MLTPASNKHFLLPENMNKQNKIIMTKINKNNKLVMFESPHHRLWLFVLLQNCSHTFSPNLYQNTAEIPNPKGMVHVPKILRKKCFFLFYDTDYKFYCFDASYASKWPPGIDEDNLACVAIEGQLILILLRYLKWMHSLLFYAFILFPKFLKMSKFRSIHLGNHYFWIP